ncbi:MAG: cation-translocating P-type ATPase [Myxococcota bacterium]
MTTSTFDPSSVSLLQIEGMWCTSCARAVEKSLSRVDGVFEAQVNFATKVAVVRGRIKTAALADIVRKAGYEAQAWTPSAGIRPINPDLLLSVGMRVALAVFCTMWVMMLQIVLYIGDAPTTAAWWIAAGAGGLATPVVFIAGSRIILAGYRTLRARAPGMDALVSLGAVAAWALSVVELGRGSSDVWFDTAAMLITLLLVGRLLQTKVQARGDASVAEALGDTPDVANRVVNGEVRVVEARSLAQGEQVRGLPGETLTIDGTVQTGTATVDRAALTGETLPVIVTPGTRMFAGDRILEGTIDLTVQAPIGFRRIDALRAQVRRALAQRSALLSTADRFAERLVPAVVALALVCGTAVGLWTNDLSQAVLRCVTVLVVTCPCAIGLAAPVALSLAVNAAARQGTVFRSYDALERASTVDTVVFDKTGTLTEGRTSLQNFRSIRGDHASALKAAASAEWGIEHPIASAIREHAHQSGITPDATGHRVVTPGQGVTWTRTDGVEVRVGRPRWALGTANQPLPDTKNTWTEVALHVQGGPSGVWTVQDSLRDDAQIALDHLNAEGISVSMWSGDVLRPVVAIGEALGIDDVRAEQSPEDKARGLQDLAAEGRRVAFVGDGANDAPALSEAYLGIASTGAVEAAMSAAPVVLLGGGVRAVSDGLALARQTRRVVRQNLAWAIAYNAAALPLAVAGVISPVTAAAAMLLSSLTVVTNATRISARGASRRTPTT